LFYEQPPQVEQLPEQLPAGEIAAVITSFMVESIESSSNSADFISFIEATF
jgi:hypothetical protein